MHRDLKPSNILVTSDGQVKLLDFGIAKLLGEEEADTHTHARTAARVLTAAYAAPEQILGGDVTVATDVFALGVVLYELLTGVLPYDRRATTPHELAARVEHETAERPRRRRGAPRRRGAEGVKRERWARRLRGDLDTITMKALAHEPERRYPSAAALAEDLRRYLTSRPVEARPDSRGLSAAQVRDAASPWRRCVGGRGGGRARCACRFAAIRPPPLGARPRAPLPPRPFSSASSSRSILIVTPARPRRCVTFWSAAASASTGSWRSNRSCGPRCRPFSARYSISCLCSKQGEAHWRRALQTRQALFGPGDARTAKAKKGLAISLARQARYAEAEPLFQRLLAHEQVLGDQRELGSVLLNYGNLKRLTGDYAAADGAASGPSRCSKASQASPPAGRWRPR